MDNDALRNLLELVQQGSLDLEGAMARLKKLPFENLGYARIDNHRSLRNGVPEVIFCQGKTLPQIQGIVEHLAQHHPNILATRASAEVHAAIREVVEDCTYHEMARIVVVRPEPRDLVGNVAVVSAGTSDIPVAEEAAMTAEVMGSRVNRLYDVGVAGIHRLLHVCDDLFKANVVGGGGRHGGRPGQRSGGAGVLPGDRGAHQRGLRRQFRRHGGASQHAQQLRLRRVGGEYRQRLRGRLPGQPDQPAGPGTAKPRHIRSRSPGPRSPWCTP